MRLLSLRVVTADGSPPSQFPVPKASAVPHGKMPKNQKADRRSSADCLKTRLMLIKIPSTSSADGRSASSRLA